MLLVFRGCRVSDLSTGVWALLNYGLANYRGTSTVATFTQMGFTTAGLSTTVSPRVAFCYSCLGLAANQTAVFAIKCSDAAYGSGSVEEQAARKICNSKGIPLPGYETAVKSVRSTREITLPNVLRNDVLGYYTVLKQELRFNLDVWTTVGGTADEQEVARRFIVTDIAGVRVDNGGHITDDVLLDINSKFLGH